MEPVAAKTKEDLVSKVREKYAEIAKTSSSCLLPKSWNLLL